jgi:hypothetical protein
MDDVPATKRDLPTPKRGAFPTPKTEIEKATPYVPQNKAGTDQPNPELTSPKHSDHRDDSQHSAKACVRIAASSTQRQEKPDAYANSIPKARGDSITKE